MSSSLAQGACASSPSSLTESTNIFMKQCPLCMEPFGIDDVRFYPCTCRYQVRTMYIQDPEEHPRNSTHENALRSVGSAGIVFGPMRTEDVQHVEKNILTVQLNSPPCRKTSWPGTSYDGTGFMHCLTPSASVASWQQSEKGKLNAVVVSSRSDVHWRACASYRRTWCRCP